ncbi:hypothetical protein BGX27_007090 [Mortierella sp. AM989]|nr:hypothetical protein BGX27_007090 [Mortierella sp. AM989]
MATRQKTLYVSGFSQRSRPRDIAYEFERFGRLVRCDVPALRNNSSKPYAFVEYEDDRDARDAYNEMRDVRFEGYRLNVQYAKNTPSASWRYERGGGGREGGRDGGRDGGRNGDRSKSPRRGARSPPRRRSPRRRSASPGDRGQPRRPRSPIPAEPRRRSSASRSPVRGRSRERDGDRAGENHRVSSRSPGANDVDKHGLAEAPEGDNHSRSPSPRRRSISPRARSVTP